MKASFPLRLLVCLAASSALGEDIDWEKAKQFWSFQTPVAQAAPGVQGKDWPAHRVDAFLLAGMEANGLSPAPVADRATLLRRAAYVLTGLPPSANDTASFLADESPAAYERLIDRLLASPAYGERMTSPWLNVARYAEDQAHQVGDDVKQFYPNAHLYRQWVMDAFNADLPYDEFIRRQLAADLLGQEDALAALGFLGLGPKYYDRKRLSVMAEEWEDRVDTVTRTFLGLTVACARCHQHKFDPIAAEDYYALAGVFASTEMHNKPFQPTGDSDKDAKVEPKNAMHVVREGPAKDLPVFIRGDVDQPGPTARRRFLHVLSEGEPRPFERGSGRLELAEEIAHPKNPLTARVMVNRLWGIVFGQPLVATPSNFGHMGERPTHPELLDDLAVRFAGDWSMKRLMRDLTLSQAFRQRSDLANGDAPNRWLARMNRQRLSGEMWRDSLLVFSGGVDPARGPSMEATDPRNLRRTVHSRVSRLDLNEFLAQFDYPDANVHSDRRSTTTTPTQKLLLLNHPLAIEPSARLAKELAGESGSTAEKLDGLYRRLFARPPTAGELASSLAFLGQPDESRWARLLQALFASNQMLFVD